MYMFTSIQTFNAAKNFMKIFFEIMADGLLGVNSCTWIGRN